jgi:hypothetical protein
VENAERNAIVSAIPEIRYVVRVMWASLSRS